MLLVKLVLVGWLWDIKGEKMKYAHIIDTKLQGWYSDDIHDTIPTPNIEVTDEVWQEALSINANCYENGKFIVKDFRTDKEIEYEKRRQFEIQFRFDRDTLLKQTDIEINKAEDIGQDSQSLRAYRQSLRDATIKWIMPESIL